MRTGASLVRVVDARAAVPSPGRTRARRSPRRQVDLEHPLPVGRIEFPEREAELARAGPDGEDDVVAPAEPARDLLGRAADRGVVGHVGHQSQRGLRKPGQVEHARIAIDGRDLGRLGRERPRDRRADPRAAPKTTTTLPARPRSTGHASELQRFRNLTVSIPLASPGDESQFLPRQPMQLIRTTLLFFLPIIPKLSGFSSLFLLNERDSDDERCQEFGAAMGRVPDDFDSEGSARHPRVPAGANCP